MLLVLAMVFPMTVPVFAASSGSEMEPYVDYDYYWDYGEDRLFYSEYKSDEQLRKEGAALSFATDVLAGCVDPSFFDPPETVLDALLPDISDLMDEFIKYHHGFGRAAKIVVYSRTDTRYRLNSLTGQWVPIRSRYTMTFDLYDRVESGAYELYHTKVIYKEN